MGRREACPYGNGQAGGLSLLRNRAIFFLTGFEGRFIFFREHGCKGQVVLPGNGPDGMTLAFRKPKGHVRAGYANHLTTD